MQPGTRQPYAARRSISVGWRIMIAAALMVLTTAPVFAAPASLPCSDVTWNAVTDTPATLRNCAAPEGASDDPVETALAFLRENHESLGLQAGLGDLEFVSLRYGLAGSHVFFQQQYRARPVLGTYVSVHLQDDGSVALLHNGALPHLRVSANVARVTAIQAVQSAREAIEFAAPRGSSPAPQLAVLPISPTEGRLVWQVMVVAASPAGDWEVLVDATTGEVIKRTNLLVFDRSNPQGNNPVGQVLEPVSPNWIAAAQDPLTLATVTLDGLDGSGWLRGDYVDLTQLAGSRPSGAFSSAGQFIYSPDDPRFEEVMVYHYVDATQRYVQSLGYSDTNTPANGIREQTTLANAHWFAQDQSFYSASDGALHFGDGGVQDAEDPDIIVHEYAHALQQDQLPYWGGGEMNAVGEGFADYLAASRFAAESIDPACIAEWDSRAYVNQSPYCLRRVDRNRQYPVDLSGDAHQDGEIWSRVLWDLRGELGALTADRLALESNFYLPPAASLADAGQALLDADRVLNDGAHSDVIRRALIRRGLLSLPAPGAPVVSGGAAITPASTVGVSWQGIDSLPVTYDVQVSLDSTLAGPLAYDFNRGGLPAGFTSYGNLPWRVEDDALRAGPISHNQSSLLELAVDLVAPGQLKFDWSVDSEAGADLFTFAVDGQTILEQSGVNQSSGFSVDLLAGQHQLVWRYGKDSTLSEGNDTVSIDNLRIENTSLAHWRPADVAFDGDGGRWRVPDVGSESARLRVRARLDNLVSPWSDGQQQLVIEEPTAVGLAGFQAAAAGAAVLPWVVWGIAGVLLMVALGVIGVRRSARATKPPSA
ncbi:MAG: M36 family metallopeptidase [Caldilineae bacterium]|nr:M36 family metallopeptidase [Caldilineae bacterium]